MAAVADKNPLAVAARPVALKARVTARSAPKAAAARVATVAMAGVTVVALPAVPQANPAMPGAHALKAASSARKDAQTTALTTAPKAAVRVKANPAPMRSATPVCVATALRSATSPVAQPVHRVSPTHCAPASTPWPTAGVTAATATAMAAVDVARVAPQVVAAGGAQQTHCAPASVALSKRRGLVRVHQLHALVQQGVQRIHPLKAQPLVHSLLGFFPELLGLLPLG